jgi:hypothetical protein
MLQDEEHAYIVQELCAGGDLKSLLDANGCVSEVEAATIMRGVLDMLVELHRCVLIRWVCRLGGLPYTKNRENNQSAFRLPSG